MTDQAVVPAAKAATQNSPAPTSVPASTGPDTPPPTRRRWWPKLAAARLLLGSGAAYWWLHRAPGLLVGIAFSNGRLEADEIDIATKFLLPTTMALLLALIPAIMMALSVVREKEFGSITNLYVTPVTRAEFILGKQLPYVALAMAGFLVTALIATLLFGVPVKGSVAALVAGTLIYVYATTAYGLLISVFASTQIAAQFGTALLTVIPATQFSGMLSPVSSLSGAGAVIGRLFPMTYYLPISVGAFTKSLGFRELAPTMLTLALFIPALLGLSTLLLRRQEH